MWPIAIREYVNVGTKQTRGRPREAPTAPHIPPATRPVRWTLRRQEETQRSTHQDIYESSSDV